MTRGGSLLYWEYRESRTQQPVLFEWGAAGAAEAAGEGEERAPRLVAALAFLHARYGVLPWARVLAPAIQLASGGFPVSEGLSVAAAAAGEARYTAAETSEPELAGYLSTLLHNTSAELSEAWDSASLVRSGAVARATVGTWRAWAGGARAAATLRALHAALAPPAVSPDDVQLRVVTALQREARADGVAGMGVATGLAAVDKQDTYVALVTGLSQPFGSGTMTAGGWRRDSSLAPLDVAPALLAEAQVCGARYVVGAESSAALAQAGAALAALGAAGAVERARLALLTGGALALEAARPMPPVPPALAAFASLNASLPYAAVNLVVQRGDALASHADSRGGGLASRF